MAELAFDCLEVRPERYGVAPTLVFRLRIADTGGSRIHTVALRCQIRIEPHRRQYSGDEPELLKSLFGERSRWGETLRAIQFANVSAVVPSFTGSTEVDISVPCTYDMEVTAGSYFAGLRDGAVPFTLLFSGTVFGKGDNGFWVEQIPWHLSAERDMPISAWWELMDIYFPGTSWLRLHRDTVTALRRYQTERAIPTCDAAIEALLEQAKDTAE